MLFDFAILSLIWDAALCESQDILGEVSVEHKLDINAVALSPNRQAFHLLPQPVETPAGRARAEIQSVEGGG